jgi:prevent-host-death family protein
MDQTITAADANRRFSRILRDVRGGRTYVVTAHGKPVARIVPCTDADASRAMAREALMRRLADQPSTDIGRWKRDDLYDR